MNVYDRILQTRPNTFVTFGPSGTVESGNGPLSHSAQGLSYSNGHILPGAPSWYAHGAGSLVFDGRFCQAPDNGGSGSIQVIAAVDEFANDSAVSIIDLDGILSVSRVTNVLNSGTRYIMTPDYGSPVILEVDSSPSVDNISVSINGSTAVLSVNELTTFATLESGLYTQGCNRVVVTPSVSGKLWGVVIRPTSIAQNYSDDVYSLITSFPLPQEAEEPFSPTTFVFDRNNLNYEELMRLEDISFDGSPEEVYLYNGSELPPMDITETVGYLNLPSFEDVHNVLFDTRGIWATLSGDITETPVGESVGPKVFPIYPLNKAVNGEPEGLHVYYDTEGVLGGSPISLNLYLLPDVVTMVSPSMPNRTADISVTSTFVGKPDLNLFGGGLVGEAYINPDVEAEDVVNYPQAYGMWVYIDSPGNLARNSVFDISVDAARSVITTGVADVYVNGIDYTSGAVSVGWNFISFIPAAPSNEVVTVGDLASTNIVYTFSEFGVATPSAYISSIYGRYVDPPSIRGVETSNVIVGDVESRVYAHDWSISSAD